MLRQTTTLVREVERAYDETTKEHAQLLRQSQSFWRSLNLIWRRTTGQQELHAKLETQVRQLMQPQMEKAIRTLEADLRGLWRQMQDLLEHQLSADLQKEARQSIPDFAGQRRELSESIQTAFINILAGKALQQGLARSYMQTSLWLRVLAATIIVAGTVATLTRTQNARVAMGALIVAGS